MTRFRWLFLVGLIITAATVPSYGTVLVSVRVGPPALPVYAQPLAPGPGYIWAPGYWGWSPNFDDYYWVPGTWVLAPQVGFLWTPGYWAFSAGLYNWYPGYWGPAVGFYGGINYGFGYSGYGYYGGYWHGRDFYYNRAVNNVSVVNVHNVYDQRVVNNNVSVNRVSYNGGPGGVRAQPTSAQLAAQREHRIAATPAQIQHEQSARSDRAQLASVNHGRPAVVATPRPGAFYARAQTPTTQQAMNRPAPIPNASAHGANSVPRPPQNNNSPAQAPQSVPRPQNTRQVRAPQNVTRLQNNQPTHAPQNVSHPANAAHQSVSSVNQAPAPHPNTIANNRPAPTMHNAPPPVMTQHTAPAPPQQQVRQANHPFQPEPQAASRPAPSMTPRPPAPHQAAPPRQTATNKPPPPKGREVEQGPR